jgi:hypothetical protein
VAAGATGSFEESLFEDREDARRDHGDEVGARLSERTLPATKSAIGRCEIDLDYAGTLGFEHGVRLL